MAWRSAFEYALRGGVSAVRGAVEGQLAAMQAQSDSEYRERMLQYQNRLADIEQYKAMSDATFREKELGELGRRADEAEKTKRYEIFTTDDGKRWIADKESDTVREVAETKARTDKEIAEIGAKTDITVAETTTQGRRDVAEIGAETDLAIEESRAATEIAKSEIDREIADKGFASAEKIAAWELANKAYIAELEKSGKGGAQGTVGLGLTPDQIDRVDKLATAYRMEKDYQDMQKMQTEYGNASAAYNRIREEAKDTDQELTTGVGDIALINIFQRFIDPGVSVREGDVDLLQKAEALTSTLELWKGRITAGAKLTPAARNDMFELITDFYTTAMARKSADLTSRYQQRIDLDGELRGSGVTVANLGTDYAAVYSQFQTAQGGAGDTAQGDGDPNETVPGLKEPTTPTATENPASARLGAPGTPRRTQVIDNLVGQAIEKKWTPTQVEAAVVSMLAAEGSTDAAFNNAFTDDVMAQFTVMTTDQGDTTDDEDETPPTRNRQDFRNRGVRTQEGDDAEQ